MNTEIIVEVKKELSKYSSFRSNSAKEILKILKNNSKTYRDIEKHLELLTKHFLYVFEDKEKYENLLKEVRILLEEEKSDLPIANHFKQATNFQ